MMNSLDDRERRLYTAVDEVLHYVWDPIGVAGVPQARGEYHDYVPEIVSLLVRGASTAELEAFLAEAAWDRMGLTAVPERARRVTSILLDWRDSLADESAELPIDDPA